jgi:hypothetical protein
LARLDEAPLFKCALEALFFNYDHPRQDIWRRENIEGTPIPIGAMARDGCLRKSLSSMPRNNLGSLDRMRFRATLQKVNRCFQSAAWFLAIAMVLVFSWPQVAVAEHCGATVQEYYCCCESPDHAHKSPACECSTSSVSAFHPILAIQSTASLFQPSGRDFRWSHKNQNSKTLFDQPPTPPPRANA